MNKEDTKENVKEALKVFVENLPNPKGWLRENMSIIIAILAFIVSVRSICLSTKDFIVTHRPYVFVDTLIKTENGKSVFDDNIVVNTCINAPARIVNREFYYIVIKTNENGGDSQEIKYESKLPCKLMLYPSGKQNSQTTILYDFKKEILAKNTEVRLRRKVKIDYKELSSDRTYYFEGNWDYNKQYNIWEPNDMFGN